MYEALDNLFTRLREHDVPAEALHLVIATFRGPDSDNDEVKAKYTAPLRLYLLGKEGYVQGGYYPRAEDVRPIIYYGLTIKGGGHYQGHVRGAVNVIRDHDVPSADGTVFEFRNSKCSDPDCSRLHVCSACSTL